MKYPKLHCSNQTNETQLHHNYNPCIHLSILLQVVTPADGGEYIIDNFGPRLIQTTEDSVYPVT